MAFAAFSAAPVLLGAGLSFVRALFATMRSAVQLLAAGVILCVLASDLPPDLGPRCMPWGTMAGVFIGVGVMLALKWAPERTGREIQGRGWSHRAANSMALDLIL